MNCNIPSLNLTRDFCCTSFPLKSSLIKARKVLKKEHLNRYTKEPELGLNKETRHSTVFFTERESQEEEESVKVVIVKTI